ncbi:MAG: hypothetical protein H0V93_03900 [Euzebyales bacterium]|jgi:acetyl-CoA carboxylase beta subunit|nr:hypothetical protein [Euzebyales bacterium]
MTEIANDVWAYCETCQRWYYPPEQNLEASMQSCPVCDRLPSAVEERAIAAAVAAS